MTTNEILHEALQDPILLEKYHLTDEDIRNASFSSTSKHQIVEVLKTIIKLKSEHTSDQNVYRNIKSVNFGIKD